MINSVNLSLRSTFLRGGCDGDGSCGDGQSGSVGCGH